MRGLPLLAVLLASALCAGVPLCVLATDEHAATIVAAPGGTSFDTAAQVKSARGVVSAAPKLPPPKQTTEQLWRILAKPEYNAQSAAPGENWLMRLFDWLERVLRKLGIAAPSWWGMVLLIAAGLGVVYLLTRVIWEWQARRPRKAAADGAQEPEVLGAEALLKAAQAAADRGDYRAAVRWRFKWLLSVLELGESALLTNRQVLSRLGRERPELREPLRELVLCYEDAWYGGLPCGARELQTAAELAEAVRSQARREAQ